VVEYNERKRSPDSSVEPPSIVYNLFKMFKCELLVVSLVKMVADVLQFANPLLLKYVSGRRCYTILFHPTPIDSLRLLIDYVSDSNGQLWEGISIALVMFLVSELRSLMVNYYFFIMYRMGIKLQASSAHHYIYDFYSS